MTDFLVSILVVIWYSLKLLAIIAPYAIVLGIIVTGYLCYKKKYNRLFIPIISIIISILLLI